MASSSSSSSSSIFSTRQRTYDVFLSFSGEDTRNTATDFIYFALEQKGIYTYKDDKKLEKGKTIESELFKAIKESRFAVVILSKNYASSTWCLNELVEIVACEKMGMTILPIFYNVDPSDVRKQKGTFAQPFDEYEKQFEEKVGTWRAALNHVANIAGCHVDNSPLSTAFDRIVGQISRGLSREFLEITEGLVGIESPMWELGSRLDLRLKDDVLFIGIWAMGGMGKTTLAEVAYKVFSKEFDACCFIDSVRERYEKGGEISLQKNLISQILNDTNLNIKNKCEGEHMIKSRLRGKRIFLVLDDVNDLKQLVKLAGRDWFGPGSRIIITTRNKQLLKEFPVDGIYEVKSLNYNDALRLFCSIAFKRNPIPNEYLELSKGFLEYAGGLPLALEVLGSSLFGKSVDEWRNALEMLIEHSEPAITRVLKVSYDGLQESVQEIFKDIACFFNHEDRDHVVKILIVLGRYPLIGLSCLIDKSLLKISDKNVLWMHDLVRDMGRNIVYQESPNEPGRRSRLWDPKDINHVLKNDTGTDEVQAIDFRGAKDTSIYHQKKVACWGWVQRTPSSRGFPSSKKQKGPVWNPNALLNMPNIKFMRIHNICPQNVPKYLSNNLKYLELSDYPSKSLPCFKPDELVELRLPRSKIKLLWGRVKIFENLKSINMDGSSNLIIAPNFNGVPNLEELVLARCSSLRKLHRSIGKLKKLKLLDLQECPNLIRLPDKFEMEYLVTLNLTYCLKVKKIPEFVGNMKLLQELLLEGTAIVELPSSVECLSGLIVLILRDCKSLVCLPNAICSLKSLEIIILRGCSKFDKLPEDLGNITSLLSLDLGETAIKELPSSVEFLIGLISLDLEDCKNFVHLPSTVCNLMSLERITLSGCSKLDKLPENLGNFTGYLKWELEVGGWGAGIAACRSMYSCLSIDGTAIEVLPSSIGRLVDIRVLNLEGCKNLFCLPNTICNLKQLMFLFLGGTAIKELPSSIIHDKCLGIVSFKGCQLSSSSLTSMPRSEKIDLSDCNLSAIPSGIVRVLSAIPSGIDCMTKFLCRLYLRGNDFVSLPESISQFSSLERLYLDGCKRLRSLSNIQIPSKLSLICVDNCISLERLPESTNDMLSICGFNVQCFNCFKLADNIQNFSNMFQGQSGDQFEKSYIFPGREIPKWFEKVNICNDKVKIQLPGSGSGCDEWRGFVLCVLFLPTELPKFGSFLVRTGGMYVSISMGPLGESTSEYGKVESHHLWLHSVSKNEFCLPKTPGCSIDKKGFQQVELEIETDGLEVEQIGFRVV